MTATPPQVAEARPPFRSLLPAAEAAFAFVTLSVVFGLNRLFAEASFLGQLFWFATGSHLVAAFCRRRGLSLGASAAVSLLALAFVTGWVMYPETTAYGLPLGNTLDAARADLALVWTLFQQVVAPAPVEPSFVLVAGIAAWTCGYIGDWAAFRLWVPFEAIVPAATIFIFGSLLGAPPHRTVATVAFLGAVIAFVLLHRVARQQTSASWLTSDVSRGSLSLVKVGGGLGLIALILGAAGGPLLPGADATAVVPWRNLDTGPGARQTVSPLVQIRGRLVDQTEVEMFTVRSTERAYWRLTALDTFDGSVWSSKGSYGAESGELADPEQFEAAADNVHQHFEIKALAALWLPAAFEAKAIAIEEVNVRWERESATLIVDTGFETSDGFSYDIDSESPRFDPAALTAAGNSPGIPGDIADNFLDLPSGFSTAATNLAEDVTRDAATPYGKALALQNYFRDNFEYSLEVSGGHSSSAIEQFLFEAQRGYCEQFAGSYAAMARAIGIPSRVAVGFSPGDPDPTVPDLFHVRGKHAHAWPEVYIGSVGWVAFEPTPGRGQPGTESYTGVADQQVDSGDVSSGTTVPATVGDGTNTSIGGGPTSSLAPADDAPIAGTPTAERPSVLRRFWTRGKTEILWSLGVIATLATLFVVGVPTAALLYRRRRRARATAADDQVRVAWAESVEALSVLGVSQRPSETLAEFGPRAARHVDADSCTALVSAAEEAEYSATGVTESDGLMALELSEHIRRTVHQKATREQRVKAALDPRPLLPRRTIRRRVRYQEESDHITDRVRVGV